MQRSQSLFGKKSSSTSNPFASQAAQVSTPSAAAVAAAPAASVSNTSSTGGVRLPQWEEVGNSRVALENNSNILTPEQARKLQYVNKLDQYSRKLSMSLKSPITNGLQECPSNNGKPWKAYRMPNPDFDKKLKDQWVIHRKDERNRNTPLFCYPDGVFDGVDFTMTDENNPAVDLRMFSYIPQKNAVESLHTFMDLIAPQNAVSNVERQKAKMTNIIIDFMNNAKIQQEKEKWIAKLASILKTFEAFAGRSEERKLVKAKKKAEGLIDSIHAIAIANIGLDSTNTAQCTQVHGLYQTKKIHGVEVSACVPQGVFEKIANDPEFVTQYEKNRVIKELVEYSRIIVKASEEIQPPNWENAFYTLTSDQKRKL
jgi:hypothetical protein